MQVACLLFKFQVKAGLITEIHLVACGNIVFHVILNETKYSLQDIICIFLLLYKYIYLKGM